MDDEGNGQVAGESEDARGDGRNYIGNRNRGGACLSYAAQSCFSLALRLAKDRHQMDLGAYMSIQFAVVGV
jgi:hypothetical protein